MGLAENVAEQMDARLLLRYFEWRLGQLPLDLHPNSNAYRDAMSHAHSETAWFAYLIGKRTARRLLEAEQKIHG